jgi:ribosome-binding factor A
MPSKLRLRRIGDRIKQEISEMLVTGKINDPRLIGLFVTEVNVDRELTFANIFVSAIEGEYSPKEILQGMEHASGFLRSTLARRIDLRTFPRLRFFWDPTPERAERIERMIDSLSEPSEESKPEEHES